MTGRKLRIFVSAVLAAILSQPVFAADKRESKKNNKEVLELDSADIVGFQRRPKIFLEFETHSPTMDSIIFKRDDFDRNQLQDVKSRFRAQVPEKKK